MAEYTDETLMPSGKYKGSKLANVPASYLIWLYYQSWTNPEMVFIKKYIKENMDVLVQEK